MVPMPKFTILEEVTRVIATVGFVSTSILVLFFNILTLFFVKRDFGTYRNLLISFSILGFLFVSSEYVVHPSLLIKGIESVQMIHSKSAGFVFFTQPQFPFEAMKIGLVAFCGLYGSTVCFIAVQFLYRYWALFDVAKLKFFEGWALSIWFSYSFSIGVIWAAGIYNFLEIDEYSTAYLKDELFYHYGLNLSAIPSFTSVIYTQEGKVRWWNLMCTIEMTMIIGSQYLIICFCGNQMSVGMKEKISMLSQTRRRLHTQFFKSLVLQILVPSIILFFPMIAIIYLPLFDLDFCFPTGVLFSAFSLYPAIDIIIILYIVSDYRTAMVSLILLLKSRLNGNAPRIVHIEPSTMAPAHPPASPISPNAPYKVINFPI